MSTSDWITSIFWGLVGGILAPFVINLFYKNKNK